MYKKETHRLTVKFLDGNNLNNVLFEINNRNHMNVGEIFSDHYVNSLIRNSIKEENLPQNVVVLVTANYSLQYMFGFSINNKTIIYIETSNGYYAKRNDDGKITFKSPEK